MSAAGGSARISVTANKIKYGVHLYTMVDLDYPVRFHLN